MKRQFDYLMQYGTMNAALLLAGALPPEASLRLGEWAGRLMAGLTRPRLELAVENLMRAFPALSRAQAEQTAIRVYEHFGRAAVEAALARRLLRPSTYRRHIVFRHEERLHRVLAAGRGAIFVTGHLGVWEIFGLLLGYLGARTYSVYRRLKNPYIDRTVRRWRASLGQVMVDREGALMKLLRVLRRGGYIALLVDQHAKADGVWVPFFGRPASTTPTPALLALRTGAPIVTGYARRLPGIYRFEVFVDEPIYATPTGDRAADVRRITMEVSRRIEGYVRRFPDQWLWLHRRWHRPPAEVIARDEHVRAPGQDD